MSIKNKNKELESEKEKYEKLSDLLKDLKDAKDLVVKQAILLGEKRVNYCKGKDLVQVINGNFADINKSLQSIVNIDIGPEPNENAYQKIFEIFFNYKLLLKLYRMEGDTLKYPKRLFPPKKEDNITAFDEKLFYWINTHSEVSKLNMVYLMISVVAILLICMFPIWPLKVKIGVWWTLFFTLILLLLFTVFCLIVVIVGVIFGYDIFILPNILETKQSWRDRFFNPLVAYYPREDSWFFILMRINMLVAIVMVCAVAWYNPALFYTAFSFVGNIGSNLYSYIQTKIVAQHNKSSSTISIMDRHNKIINDIE